ncbi:hypothetical protein [Aureitalea marina]|uniref:hypothetical protein n=1 Tax=Aureitalea marina TaxID=930804 RepID=UPI0015E2A4F7|nr:hypothetical protein [Aureitalea marina]
MSASPLLSVKDLKVSFDEKEPDRDHTRVSFDLKPIPSSAWWVNPGLENQLPLWP